MSQKKKIRWAFDPFESHTETWERVLEFLSKLGGPSEIEITPTYILGSDFSEWVAYSSPDEKVEIEDSIKKALISNLERIDQKGILKDSVIIRSGGESRRSDVATLVQNMEGYDLLVINTHARKGLQRLLLGSFAESLLLKCRYPIVFISPNTKAIEKLDRVFFPTDLTAGSRGVFESFLENPFNRAKEIVLYSKVVDPVTAVFSGTSAMFGGGTFSIQQYLSDQKKAKEEEAELWRKKAEAADFKIEVLIDTTPTSVSDGVMSFSKEKKCDLIAMPSFANQMDTILAGSKAREIVRQSTIPVLVWHVKRDNGEATVY